MEKLLYFVGGIIVGSIGTLAALGFTEEKLDEMRQEEDENWGSDQFGTCRQFGKWVDWPCVTGCYEKF